MFNDSAQDQIVTVTSADDLQGSFDEPVSGRRLTWQAGRLTLTLEAEDVAVLTLAP